MRRRLFSILAALSFLLFLAACVMWVRSYFVWEQWALPPQGAPRPPEAFYVWKRRCYIESCRGRLRLIEHTFPVVDPLPDFAASSPVRYYQGRSQGNFYDAYTRTVLGFEPKGRRSVVLPGMEFRAVPAQLYPTWAAPTPMTGRPIVVSGFRLLSISCWLVTLLAAVLPVFWAHRRWRQYRRVWRLRRNLCPACGYDLRATPEQCPECGVVMDDASRGRVG